MELLLIRHAIAERASSRGEAADARRPLTAEGRRRMARGARGLMALVAELDAVVPSPLVRAVETARIVADAFELSPEEGLPALAPGHPPQELLEWLRASRHGGTVALVGHEPHLSGLAALLVAGDPEPLFTFRKGGACLLELDGAPRPGGGRLRWLATARLLRLLGARKAR
ncbi:MULTISPECIES: phosphohistidine phosphatase SixA [Anaeromyxobacter]|uniref:phosphohistidine phosphatase SixA n=1 Tax=Anaeromyxobacter TaxID=161492 RepID=UPI001F5A4B30|nr:MULTISPECIES: phosphohistidine phosphatase SixA [unclassified Anaeromyxobacter]